MDKELVTRGMGASPGLATGEIVFRSEDAVSVAAAGRACILVRIEMTAEDVPGMKAAAGMIASRGGLTGDAAIVARSLGKPCISGCTPMRVDYSAEEATVWRDSTSNEADVILKKGDVISIDGAKGEIWR